MKRSTLLKVAAALGVAAGLASPASAQVSAGLQQAAFGGSSTTSGGVTTYSPGATGYGALNSVGTTTTVVTKDNNNVTTGSQITSTSGSGGKVGTFQASLSEGDQQRFAVGTSTNIGVNASSSSTSDYQANSTATFGIGTSNLRQTIGTSGIAQTQTERTSQQNSYVASTVETEVGNSAESFYNKQTADSAARNGYTWWSANSTYSQAAAQSGSAISTAYTNARTDVSERAISEYGRSAAAQEASNGVISGSFVSSSSQTGSPAPATGSENANNQVTVKGIGNAASVNAMGNSNFSSVITARGGTPAAGTSGTASGSAGANVSSTASADAAATKFSSVFIQAY